MGNPFSRRPDVESGIGESLENGGKVRDLRTFIEANKPQSATVEAEEIEECLGRGGEIRSTQNSRTELLKWWREEEKGAGVLANSGEPGVYALFYKDSKGDLVRMLLDTQKISAYDKGEDSFKQLQKDLKDLGFKLSLRFGDVWRHQNIEIDVEKFRAGEEEAEQPVQQVTQPKKEFDL